MDGVNFVITWNKEIQRPITQMFMLVICCLWVTGIYFLGRLLDLMLSIHQNTWRGMSNAESGWVRQSSSWGNTVRGLGGVPHSLGSKHGHPHLSLARKHLGALDKCPSAKGSSSHQPHCRHFISAVAWHADVPDKSNACISALSYLSPLPGRAFPVDSSSVLLVGHGCQVEVW